MTPEQWREVQRVLEHALTLDQPGRDAFVATELAALPDLHGQVDRLLSAHDATGPLDRMQADMDAFADETPDRPGRIGVWRIEELIGRGGMGSVFRAERADGHYAQSAALKLLRQDVTDPGIRRRFFAERQILARIEHPGIARILDGGVTDEGRPWFAMEYVDGRPIDEWCDEQGLGVRQRLTLFRQVCAAVQHAHAHLVVHRDIKPANILVTAEGTPKLLDFGIARLLDASNFPDGGSATDERTFLLTPGHASPEQLRAESVGTASDVFQLGILLFLLLTGRLPRRFPRPPSTGAALAERPSAAAPKPSGRGIDGDLDTIVLAATCAEPDRRYASVDQLSEDVQRWLDRLPIRAQPDTFAYRTGHFVRRNRVGLAVASAFAISLISFASVTAIQADRLEHERDRARRVITFLADLFEGSDPDVAGAFVAPIQRLLELDATGASFAGADSEGELRQIAGQLFAGSPALRRAQVARAAALGARILWVDDEIESNRYEIMLLSSLGANVIVSPSTEDAILQLQGGTWDLVLSDMVRDGRSGEGTRLLEWIREHRLPVPVVFYIMNADPSRDRPFGSFGITNRPDELIHLVFDALERSRL